MSPIIVVPDAGNAEEIILDPVTEDAANAELVLNGAYGLLEHSYSAPPVQAQWASSVSTEGARLSSWKHENRQITLKLDVIGRVALNNLQAKIAKLQREGGTYQRTLEDLTVIVFDVLSVSTFDVPFDHLYHFGDIATVSIVFDCAPYGRGPEIDMGDNVETALPCLVFNETGVKGDIPPLGRLVIDDDSANDQWFVMWGIQSRYYSSSANAALFYEAEGRTPLGGATAVAGPTGASGAGSNVIRHTALSSGYSGVLSTQASGGGAHLSHVGTFRVWARVQIPLTNTGAVSARLEWSEGDYTRSTQNTPVELDVSWEGSWRLLDLGLVSIREVSQGTQRWEGRLLAKSTVVGDDIDVDCLFLQPVDEGSGEARSLFQIPAPTTYSALDEFTQTAGALTGKTLSIGGTWAFATGDATDFNVDGVSSATRTAVSDTAARFQQAGSADYTAIVVQAYVRIGLQTISKAGVYARYLDSSNWTRLTVTGGVGPLSRELVLERNVAGAISTTAVYLRVSVGATIAVRLAVLGTRAFGYAYNAATNGELTTLTAEGSMQSTGKIGIVDYKSDAAANTRYFDDFRVWVPPADAAIFASQSLEVSHDRVTREDSAGTVWSAPSKYEGDYLRVPPAGAENRIVRTFIKASRNPPGTGPDSGIDDISARLYVQPRWLIVPAP